jgi:hypothetical protein
MQQTMEVLGIGEACAGTRITKPSFGPRSSLPRLGC